MKRNTAVLACLLALGTTLSLPKDTLAQSTPPTSVISLADLRNQLAKVQSEVSATVISLNSLKEAAKKPGELNAAATGFTTRFRTLESSVETTRKNAITVKARVKDHYDAWQKTLTEMQNAKLREKAQDRFTESQKQFGKIVAQATEAKDQVLPFVSDLKDVVIYLEADQSDEAVDSLSNTIWKLGNRSKSVNSSIGNVIEQIDRTIKSLPQK
jgi:hypothetical protein